MKGKILVRAAQPHKSAQSVLLRLFSVNDDGQEALLATSSPIHTAVAMSVCRLLDQPSTIAPSINSLQKVLWIPGKTAWASATAANAQAAAQQACLQHDMKSARGILVMITLSPDSSIVASMKSAVNVIHWETPAVTERAYAIAHDERQKGQVRVEVLLTGMSHASARINRRRGPDIQCLSRLYG